MLHGAQRIRTHPCMLLLARIAILTTFKTGLVVGVLQIFLVHYMLDLLLIGLPLLLDMLLSKETIVRAKEEFSTVSKAESSNSTFFLILSSKPRTCRPISHSNTFIYC